MRKLVPLIACLLASSVHAQTNITVSPQGSDNNPGTIQRPLKTLGAAITKAIGYKKNDISIQLRRGTYCLTQPIQIFSNNFHPASLIIESYPNERAIISGAQKINPDWKPYRDGILVAHIKLSEAPDQLFANGKTLHMARYPNYDSTARVYNGTAADAISEERTKKWMDPAGGYIHALHRGEWGDFHFMITGRESNGIITYEGGWQNNRPSPMNEKHRFVENIFEELDAPGEWYYNKKTENLFLYPPNDLKVDKTEFTVSSTTDLLHLKGTSKQPLSHITIRNIDFTQTSRTFMLVKEPLLRSDWCIYRGGGILLDGTENISISGCDFYELGGNAVFLSNYNKNDEISDNHIHDIGGNAIAFVGNPDAVRSPAFRYERSVPWSQMDYKKGPKTIDFPQYCTASGNLIHQIGTIEKQVAGIEISMSSHITVSHNSIYHVPRSGINVSEGTWGGHIIEFNDVFNTVLETGDHGSYNSWGRDRYWNPNRRIIDSIVVARPGIELLDVISPIILRNNRFQCDHGWDIDLDDGSSNYEIYNNLCLSGGLKLREGYQRIVTNNIIYNNTFHPHVWLKNSRDVFAHNIVTNPYAPAGMTHWGERINENYFLTKQALDKAQSLNQDSQSLSGDADFVDTPNGNFQIKPDSPAMTIGFKNFDMDNFGVTSSRLMKIALKPTFKPLIPKLTKGSGAQIEWLGGTFKNIESLGERSAAGIPNNNGALLIKAQAPSLATGSGLQTGDVLIKLGDDAIKSIADLMKVYEAIKWKGHASASIIRNQQEQNLDIQFK